LKWHRMDISTSAMSRTEP